MTAPHQNPDAIEQLARTERYLQQDPGNSSLLARGFDLAMGLGDLAVEGRYVDVTLAAQSDDPPVRFRQAELLSACYAGMILDGDTADPGRFDRLAQAVLAGQAVGGGKTMADLLRRYRGS